MGNFEYADHLSVYMKERAERYVENMGANTPEELRELPKERLIYNIVEFATPILRGMGNDAILSACYRLTTMIRWPKQNPGAGKYKR